MGNLCGKNEQKRLAWCGFDEKPVENIAPADIVQNPAILETNEDSISNSVCFGAGCYWCAWKFIAIIFLNLIFKLWQGH